MSYAGVNRGRCIPGAGCGWVRTPDGGWAMAGLGDVGALTRQTVYRRSARQYARLAAGESPRSSSRDVARLRRNIPWLNRHGQPVPTDWLNAANFPVNSYPGIPGPGAPYPGLSDDSPPGSSETADVPSLTRAQLRTIKTLRKLDRKDVRLDIKATDVSGKAVAETSDASSRSALLRSIPWIAGGVVVIVGISILIARRRARRGGAR